MGSNLYFRTIAVIKPFGMQYIGGILRHLHQRGFTILKCRMIKLRKEQAEAIYIKDLEESHYP